ncbi:hypothetical protein K438DRAFT_1829598 [Mycena galopus ATCC 62051]|nr:hypothetical protein K438DRAFT_1829598 [Mycena galopus ATCC 62051]
MSNIPISITLWALSLVPTTAFHYLTLGLVAGLLIIYAADRHSPSHKLWRVEKSIQVAEEILENAKLNCGRDQVECDWWIFSAKLSASKIQTRLLETRSVETWKEYLQNIRGILGESSALWRGVN